MGKDGSANEKPAPQSSRQQVTNSASDSLEKRLQAVEQEIENIKKRLSI